jgi:glycosyltransferase involved in cell wall biosynthesis
MASERRTLLCLSHLNWDHVWQRPQQLMTRFARRYDVIFVDPPEVRGDVEAPHLREMGVEQGVRWLRPMFPARDAGWPDGYWRLWHGLLPETMALAGPAPILWVLSPLADQLVERARPQTPLVVYDCMDDLASFKDGTAQMRIHEERLFALADLVFTGGRSMYEARKDRHPRVHCFASGVDTDHYRQTRDPATPEAPELAAIPRPRLGYFGVLDERIDWPLIAEVAARRPAWHWTLVGPTAKVDPAELPRAANIHYLGQQPAARLPSLLKGFDIATMPFAMNEATRFISPTKTLEYLAGGKSVLSTPVPDVVAQYSEIVAVASGVDAWIAAAEDLLAGPPDLEARLTRARPVLEASTWDSIVERMAGLMEERLATAVRA